MGEGSGERLLNICIMSNLFYQLKIALRNLRRNGLYSVINVSGLAVGLAVCILISLWVKDELSYDRFHKDGDRIYRVLTLNKGSADYWSTSPAPLASFSQTNVTGIEAYCRIGIYYRYQCSYLDYENTKFRDVAILPVDTSFFDMFDFSLIKGNLREPFPDDLSAIISESKAKAFFGDEDPIGKMLKTPNDFAFRITGVMKDIPENSSVRADLLVRFDVQQRTFRGNGNWTLIEEDWGSSQYETYFKLAGADNPETIAKAIAEKRNISDREGYRLQPLYEMHLYDLAGQPAGIKNVYIFSVIAVLILVIACVNHVNLVTARAGRRSREMGVRKISGAGKSNLFGQLMSETAVMLFTAAIAGTALIYLLLPFYNDLAGKNMRFDLLDRSTVLIYLSSGAFALLLAGLYPAFTMASFRPIDAFGTGPGGKGKTFFRKILVVSQFAFSAALIVATLVVASQLQYMQNMNPGYDKENILTVELPGVSGTHYRTMMERLSSEPGVAAVSASTFNRMICDWSRGDVWKDKENRSPSFAFGMADPGFFSFMNISIVEGRSFREIGGGDEAMSQRGILVNEMAAKLIGEGASVVGMQVSFNGANTEIVGVMKDFNFHNLHSEIVPLVIGCSMGWEPYLYVKTAPGKTKQAVAAVEKIWKEYNADYEFNYGFLDDNFDRIYRADIRTGKLFTCFAVIAIFISCLGLFGLVTYTAETKTKEIGIRKVLGASVPGIVRMLLKEFAVLVGIAMLVAFPVAYWLLDSFLQDYAYRISIGWRFFIAAGLLTIVLTLLTVGWQALKAATANPVKSIKTE